MFQRNYKVSFMKMAAYIAYELLFINLGRVPAMSTISDIPKTRSIIFGFVLRLVSS